jgi:hypothetical protein
MPPKAESRLLYEGIAACMAEARHPCRREIEAVAAKIWREAYAPSLQIRWEHVERGSQFHRRLLAAARIALDPPCYAADDSQALLA